VLNKVKGFEVEVTVKDAIPHVRISFADGRQVMQTDALSIIGLEDMSTVFARAARMAYNELDIYWMLQHEELGGRDQSNGINHMGVGV
jgi:hypothetical protein